MAKKSNLVGLARGRPKVQKDVLVVEETPKTPEEVRDLKAKKTVEKLLEDVDLSPNSNSNIVFEQELKPKEGKQWLEEEIAKLTEENEKLKLEADEAKTNYEKLFVVHQHLKGGTGQVDNSDVKSNIIKIFIELQNNLLGNNSERHSWSTVSVKYLLDQMLELFPFTSNYKKF